MKRAVLLGIFALLPLAAAGDGAITSDERTYLLDQLEQSKKGVLASISGLTQSQWKFKPAPNVWSVQECAEHIILAEDFIFGGVQQTLKSPAVERPANSNAEYDRKLTVGVQDRSRKATAPEPITPTAKFATPGDAANLRPAGTKLLHMRKARMMNCASTSVLVPPGRWMLTSSSC